MFCIKGRPCQGCIKRDLATTCLDNNRKKIKPNTSSNSNTESDELYSPTTSVPFTPADGKNICYILTIMFLIKLNI